VIAEDPVTSIGANLAAVPWDAIANAASIAGFLLTVWVFWDVRNLRNFYLFKARVPELQERLSTLASSISSSLSSGDVATVALDEVLAELEILMRSLRQKTQSHSKSAAKRILKMLKAYPSNRSAEQLRVIYLEIRKLDQEITLVQQDAAWER
jgi:hypothetical protein